MKCTRKDKITITTDNSWVHVPLSDYNTINVDFFFFYSQSACLVVVCRVFKSKMGAEASSIRFLLWNRLNVWVQDTGMPSTLKTQLSFLIKLMCRVASCDPEPSFGYADIGSSCRGNPLPLRYSYDTTTEHNLCFWLLVLSVHLFTVHSPFSISSWGRWLVYGVSLHSKLRHAEKRIMEVNRHLKSSFLILLTTQSLLEYKPQLTAHSCTSSTCICLTSTANVESQINITCTSLDCGRKPGYLG